MKFAQQRTPLGVFGFDLRLEKPQPAAAFAFGRAKRKTCAARQFVGSRSLLRGFRNPDPGGDLPHPVDEDRPLQRGTQRVGQGSHGTFVVATDDDREYVLLEAPQQRIARQSGLQMFGYIFDHRVATGPPQCIVDLVKAVEVDQSEGDDAGMTLRQRIAETLHYCAMVGQSRQRVLPGQIERLFGTSIERTKEVA